MFSNNTSRYPLAAIAAAGMLAGALVGGRKGTARGAVAGGVIGGAGSAINRSEACKRGYENCMYRC